MQQVGCNRPSIQQHHSGSFVSLPARRRAMLPAPLLGRIGRSTTTTRVLSRINALSLRRASTSSTPISAAVVGAPVTSPVASSRTTLLPARATSRTLLRRAVLSRFASTTLLDHQEATPSCTDGSNNSTAAGVATRRRINITPDEQRVFALFLAVNEHYKLGCTIRVAGGWVRNKVCPISS